METPRNGMRRLIRSLGPIGQESRRFGHALGRGCRGAGQLMIVGTPTYEPWHFTAHVAEEAERRNRPELAPTLMRWSVPEGAPPHLATPVDAIARASRTATVLAVVDGDDPGLLERISDATRRGARVMTIAGGEGELTSLAHEQLVIDAWRGEQVHDACQHIVSATAPDVDR